MCYYTPGAPGTATLAFRGMVYWDTPMQRVTDILAGFLQFLAQFTKRFFVDLATAVYFRAIEYDGELKMTKTPTQRILIWSGIVLAVFTILAILLQVLYGVVSNLNIGTYSPPDPSSE